MYQVNLLGLPIYVLEDTDIQAEVEKGELRYYVVSRVSDIDPSLIPLAVRQRNTRTPCESCNEICWLDPKGFDQMRGMKFYIICIQCMVIKTREGKATKD